MIDQAAKQVGKALEEADVGNDKNVMPPKGLKKPKKEQKEEADPKEVPSEPGCKNFPKGWTSKRGSDCEDYAEGGWCTRHGGYGDAWLDEWGTFEDDANAGRSATDVCCVCGGGWKEGEPMPVIAGSPSPGGGPSPAAAMSPAPAGPSGPLLGTKAGRALQSQGYSGELVEHEDEKTMTSDWGREFGPHSGHRDVKKICADHPGNEWCLMHGYYDDERKSSALRAPVGSFVLVVAGMLFARV